MNADTKKQFLHLNGVPIVIHTLKKFSECNLIDYLCLMVPPADEVYCRKLVQQNGGIRANCRVFAGGKTRQESVYKGLLAIEKEVTEKDLVVIHDGVRPLVNQKMIEACISKATETGACIMAAPAQDTLKRVTRDSDVISETFARQRVWLAQTPQVFSYKLLKDAHERALENNFEGTDDAALVERMHFPVHIVPGSRINIKITTPEDLTLAEALLKSGC